MNFKDKLQEAYEAGYRQALNEQVPSGGNRMPPPPVVPPVTPDTETESGLGDAVNLPSDLPQWIIDLIRQQTGQGPRKILKRYLKGRGLPKELRPELSKAQRRKLLELIRNMYPDLQNEWWFGTMTGIMLKWMIGEPLTFLERQILKIIGIDFGELVDALLPEFNEFLSDLFGNP
jgi:hypothetical protein